MSQLSGIKVSTPTYTDIVPSTEQEVKMKPFRVADEKVLLMASESKDTGQMITALKEVVGNCVEGIDVDKLASFDLEYLFMKLRSVSVGERTELASKCVKCEATNKFEIDISEVKVQKADNHIKEIKVSDQLMFMMKYPDITSFVDGSSFEQALAVIIESVDIVIYGEETIKITEAEKKDLKEIIENLTTSQFALLREFFDTMPKLKHLASFTCEQCGEENHVKLEGLGDFF